MQVKKREVPFGIILVITMTLFFPIGALWSAITLGLRAGKEYFDDISGRMAADNKENEKPE